MRIVITGATGNLGTSLLTALAQDGDVREVVGVVRRVPLPDPGFRLGRRTV